MNREVKQQIHELAEQIYKEGYNDGYDDKGCNLQEMYEKGLNRAWECARQITNRDIDVEEIFGDMPLMLIFRKYTAFEAIDKIKECKLKWLSQQREVDISELKGKQE